MKATFLPLCFMIIGSSLIHYYLYHIRIYDSMVLPFSFVWIGALLCSASIICLYEIIGKHRKATSYALVAVFILSFSLHSMYTTRFDVLNGIGAPDILGEYGIARKTLADARWPVFDPHRYSTCLSVTILPVCISEVSGLSLETTFKVIFPALTAMISIFIFLFTREIFGDIRISFLSAVLISTNYFSFNILSCLGRQVIAEILLLTLLYALLHKRSIGLCIVAVVSMFGIVFSHYLIDIFSIFILFGVVIAPFIARIFRRDISFKPLLTKRFFLLFIAISYAWFMFIAFNLFLEQVSIGKTAVLSILGLYESPPHIFYQYITGSPRGPIITAWFNMENLMIIGGLLYALKYRGDPKKIVWILGGFFMLSFLSVSYLIPVIGKAIFPARIPLFGWLFFSASLALLLKRMERARILKVFFLTFLFLSLPMNMLLPNTQGILLYNPESSLTPDQIALQTPQYNWNVAVVQWIENDLSDNETILVDILGGNTLARAPNEFRDFAKYPTFTKGKTSCFLLLHEYYIKYGIWITHSAEGQRVTASKNVTFTTMAENNIIYSNAHFILVRAVSRHYVLAQ